MNDTERPEPAADAIERAAKAMYDWNAQQNRRPAMQLSSEERAALVEEVVNIMRCPIPVAIAHSTMLVDKHRAEMIVSMIDRLLATRPEPAADAEPEPGIPGTKMTGAYEAMMELSMYVGEEEWDSAQRHIRPASRRVSLRDAQAYTVAAYEKERQAKENGDG